MIIKYRKAQLTNITKLNVFLSFIISLVFDNCFVLKIVVIKKINVDKNRNSVISEFPKNSFTIKLIVSGVGAGIQKDSILDNKSNL